MDRYSVMIVDDSEADRYLLKRQLQETGLTYKIFEESDGKGALKFFHDYEDNRQKFPEDYPPLVVFLDINMPIVSGFDFLKDFGPVREKHGIEAGFILMFTSTEQEDDRKKALSYDFVKGFLTKGQFSSEQLKSEILNLNELVKG